MSGTRPRAQGIASWSKNLTAGGAVTLIAIAPLLSDFQTYGEPWGLDNVAQCTGLHQQIVLLSVHIQPAELGKHNCFILDLTCGSGPACQIAPADIDSALA